MRRSFFFAVAAAWLLCQGCASPSYIKVTQERVKTTPFTNIFTVYVDEACNFSLADSTGYNICLKTHFDDTASVKTRNRIEQMIAVNLSTRGTAVYGSCDLLGVKTADMTVDNSYADFRKLVDSLHVDGILVVQLKYLERVHVNYPGVATPGSIGPNGVPIGGSMSGGGPGVEESGFYDFYLLDPKDLIHPIWSAKMDTKWSDGGRELSHSMARKLAKKLISEGYTVHGVTH